MAQACLKALRRSPIALPAPSPCDLLVIDETSRVDVLLMHALLKAMPNTAALLVVGTRGGAGIPLVDLSEPLSMASAADDRQAKGDVDTRQFRPGSGHRVDLKTRAALPECVPGTRWSTASEIECMR
jgi:hypothetical protein